MIEANLLEAWSTQGRHHCFFLPLAFSFSFSGSPKTKIGPNINFVKQKQNNQVGISNISEAYNSWGLQMAKYVDKELAQRKKKTLSNTKQFLSSHPYLWHYFTHDHYGSNFTSFSHFLFWNCSMAITLGFLPDIWNYIHA